MNAYHQKQGITSISEDHVLWPSWCTSRLIQQIEQLAQAASTTNICIYIIIVKLYYIYVLTAWVRMLKVLASIKQ